MAFALVGLGLRQLSVAPRSVARVKKIVRSVAASAAAAAAEEALNASSAQRAEAVLRNALQAAAGA